MTCVYLVASVVVLAGCGRIGFDATGRATDAPSDTVAACGPAVFADDFGDGTLGPLWTISSNPAITVVESGGVMTFSLVEGMDEAYADLATACRYDMRDREVSVEVLAVPDGDPRAELFVELSIDGDNRLGFDVFDGMFEPYHRIAGTYTALGTLAHDAAMHRFWRLRETTGMMIWETSPDRVAWTIRATEPTPLDLSNVEVGIHAGTFGAATSPPGAAIVDNLDAR